MKQRTDESYTLQIKPRKPVAKIARFKWSLPIFREYVELKHYEQGHNLGNARRHPVLSADTCTYNDSRWLEVVFATQLHVDAHLRRLAELERNRHYLAARLLVNRCNPGAKQSARHAAVCSFIHVRVQCLRYKATPPLPSLYNTYATAYLLLQHVHDCFQFSRPECSLTVTSLARRPAPPSRSSGPPVRTAPCPSCWWPSPGSRPARGCTAHS